MEQTKQKMQADLESELESDTSSINEDRMSCPGSVSASGGGGCIPSASVATAAMIMPMSSSGGSASASGAKEQLEKRVDSLLQENRVLKMEIETDRMRIKALQEENKELRKASVSIQVPNMLIITFRYP